ncbi:MAG: tocopherol cyclase family protein [Lachnospiraceae bacterium]|nr:tocopherol cyclase family protein [Lachnospiraceae bacterium]
MGLKDLDFSNIELPKVELPKVDIKNPLDIIDHSFNKPDINRDVSMLKGQLANNGYDWWWHSFTGKNKFTGEERSFFIEFFTINPELGGKEPVLGQLPANKENGKKPSYLMVKVGTWGKDACQLHRFFGWDQVNIKTEAPFLISADNCFLSETRTLGRVEISPEVAESHPEYLTDAGAMTWDLKIDKKIAFNVGYGAGKMLRDMDAFQMFWHAEGMKTAFSGEVVFNGTQYEVSPETCYGYADKNWGSDFTSPWIWLSSNDVVSKITGKRLENTVFDIGGGRPKVGPLTIENTVLSAFWYEGQAYEFNFSKFWTLTKTVMKTKETKSKMIWRILQETPVAKMLIQVECPKSEMLKIRYESPDGAFRHKNLWNGGTGEAEIKLYKKNISLKNKWEWELVDYMEAHHVGCEYGVYDEEKK